MVEKRDMGNRASRARTLRQITGFVLMILAGIGLIFFLVRPRVWGGLWSVKALGLWIDELSYVWSNVSWLKPLQSNVCWDALLYPLCVFLCPLMFWSDAWFCWQDDICFCLDLNVAGTSSICCRTGGWYLCILGLIQFLWVNINHAYWVSRMPWTCYPHRNEVVWPYKILQAGYTCPKASRWFIRWKSGPSTWRWPDCNKCWWTFPCLMAWQWTPRVFHAWNPYFSMVNSHFFVVNNPLLLKAPWKSSQQLAAPRDAAAWGDLSGWSLQNRRGWAAVKQRSIEVMAFDFHGGFVEQKMGYGEITGICWEEI